MPRAPYFLLVMHHYLIVNKWTQDFLLVLEYVYIVVLLFYLSEESEVLKLLI